MPQGSVLGPILFLVYINDLEEGVTGKILKFADDTKLFTKTKEIGDKQYLQDDIDKLVKCSEKWQMLFNFGKCKCLHIYPSKHSTSGPPKAHMWQLKYLPLKDMWATRVLQRWPTCGPHVAVVWPTCGPHVADKRRI